MDSNIFTVSSQSSLQYSWVSGGKEQEPGGCRYHSQGRQFGEGGKGGIFEVIEEGVDWCGPRIIWEEEFHGEVLGWVWELSDL